MSKVLTNVPLICRPSGVRLRPLCATSEYHVSLVYYPPGIVQRAHEHEHSHLSFLLAGGFGETIAGEDREVLGPHHDFMPSGLSHAVDFGWSGALTLHFEFLGERVPRLAHVGRRPSGVRHLALARLIAQQVDAPEPIASDLIACAELNEDDLQAPRALPMRELPQWLRRAAEWMIDDPQAEISTIAASLGVHRVHLSREFQRHLRLSPTQFRLQAKCARAIDLVITGGASPSEAAAGAGFADQAHWNRAAKATGAIAPGRLRSLLAA